jgi:hypothetical protein
MSNDLIIKSFDTGFKSSLCLIIKGLDNQAQKFNYQIRYKKDDVTKKNRLSHVCVMDFTSYD